MIARLVRTCVSLALVAAAAACSSNSDSNCGSGSGSSESGGLVSGASSSSSCSASGVTCDGVAPQNNCQVCAFQKCCPEAAACKADSACSTCASTCTKDGTCGKCLQENPAFSALNMCALSQCDSECTGSTATSGTK